jgi:amidophosphoribosyltransferase
MLPQFMNLSTSRGDKIAQMLSSPEIKAEVKIIFQTVEVEHIASSRKFDWYFTGDYPTGGVTGFVSRIYEFL